MDNIIFYHVLKNNNTNDLIDYSLWFDTRIQLKIVADLLPDDVVCPHAPQIHWINPFEFSILQKKKICFELPSLFHVPVFLIDFKDIPKDHGIMMPIFEFEWMYYATSDNPPTHLIRFLPHQVYIENKFTDRVEWLSQSVRPSFQCLHSKMETLTVREKRMLLGLSKVLGEEIDNLSALCNWSRQILDYDLNQLSFHNVDWIETWWDILDNVDKHSVAVHIGIFKRAKNQKEWYEDMPTYRWVKRNVIDKDELYKKEVMLFQKIPDLCNLRNKYLFDKVLTLDNCSSHYLFTQQSVQCLSRLEGIRGELQHDPDDSDFVPSSAGLIICPENPHWYIINVRKVNYRIMPNGSYITLKNGLVSAVYNGVSKNEFYFADRETMRPVSPSRPMREDEITQNRREEEVAIVGVEDVRLVPKSNGNGIWFYGTTKSYSYSDAIRMMEGEYDVVRGMFCNTRIIRPPYEENACEKNWVWCGHNRYIYRWHPVEIGSVDDNNRLVIDERLSSPSYFREFRGSSPAVIWKGLHFFTVHAVVHGDNGRKYTHSVVVLDLTTDKKVMAVSQPFCFEDVQIEYNVGMDIYKGHIMFLYSTMDRTSKWVRVPLHKIIWDMHCLDEEGFKTKILQEDVSY